MRPTVAKTSYLNFCLWQEYGDESYWDIPDFPEIINDSKDVIIQISQTYLGRLDLVSYDYYGDAELWWIIALANDLLVLPSNMYLNQTIRIPARQNVIEYLEKAKNI